MKLRVEAPRGSWSARASKMCPDVEIRVLAILPRSERTLLELVELDGARWKDAVHAVRDLPSVRSVEILEAFEDGGKVRFASDSAYLLRLVEETGIMPQFPYDVRDGTWHWLVICAQERGRAFIDALEREGVMSSIEFAGEYAPRPALTPRQQELLEAAVKEGLYDYPRRITLSDLAVRLHIAKSTLSEALMVIEREVVGEVVNKERSHSLPPRPLSASHTKA